MSLKVSRGILAAFILVATVACSPATAERQLLRLATTTSTEDSGLLAAILPDFEAAYDARVDVIAVGTGQAIALGEAGDVDVILVHARTREEQFVAEGHGLARVDVMTNDFVLVGPADDPAGVEGMALAAGALVVIAEVEAAFASRGDDSGTHIKELSLWQAAGIDPGPADEWYSSLGQGMGDTLVFANEAGAYTLADRGTFLALRGNLPNLEVMVGGAEIGENQDPALLNPYGVIAVNPDKGGVDAVLAQQFIEWLTANETQQAIAEFGVEQFGQPLFYPDRRKP